MALQARISPIWRKQKLIVSLFFWALAAWFIKDGAWSWPHTVQHWQEWKTNPAAWQAAAQAQEWKPEKPPHTRNEILVQFYLAGVLGAIGALLFTYWATQKKRTLKIDDEAVYTPSGNRVPFNAIVAIGKKKWESKGLATVRYEDEGKQCQFVVDDYKFETEPTHAILAEIEERLLARMDSPA